MTEYVYTFTPDGAVHGLLNDKVLDTRVLGERKVERITLIEHCNDQQQFFITWLKGPWTGCIHTTTIDKDLLGENHDEDDYPKEPILFDSYEDAVQHEIKCVNELRRRGVDFAK